MTKEQTSLEKARKQNNVFLTKFGGHYEANEVEIQHDKSVEYYEEAVSELQQELKQKDKLINGYHCGYGSLWEQGYSDGSEHAESHYKPLIELKDKRIKELEERYCILETENDELKEGIETHRKKVVELKKKVIDVIEEQKPVMSKCLNVYQCVAIRSFADRVIEQIKELKEGVE